MPTITYPKIHARVADTATPRPRANSPKPAAIRAIYTLDSLLAELDAADRADVLNLLKEELVPLAVTA